MSKENTSIISMVMDKDYAGLTKHVEQLTASKIRAKIDTKKDEFRAKINKDYDTEA